MPFGVWTIPALLALVPAVMRWWSGRMLVAHLYDPALPERAVGQARNGAVVAILAAAFIVFNFPQHAIWALPLMALARMVAWYPARRRILDESWSLGAYLWFYVRLFVGSFGFWIVLALLPTIANRDGAAGSAIAGTLAIVLIAWSRRHPDVLRFLMSTRPVSSPALLRRFEALADKAGLPQPWFDQVDLRGGVLANAIALPSLRRSAVVFTDTLIDRLEPDESAAICAHELAHLEYYDRARLTRLAWISIALVVIGAAIAPLVRMSPHPALVHPARALWPIVLVVTLAVLARHRQRNETASDLRAVALTGDAEALVRGLATVHAIARVPRRWNADAERQATHPSLARRIQAIRRAAGTAPAALDEPMLFTSAKGGATVTFDRDQLRWSADANTERLAYDALQEGRIEIKGGAPWLVTVDTGGRRRVIALKRDDVGAVQRALDLVDARFSPIAGATPAAAAFSRVTLTIAAVGALVASQLALMALTIAAIVRPAMPVVAATGAASLVSGVLFWRDRRASMPGVVQPDADATSLLLALAGVVLLLLAFVRRGEDAPRWLPRVVPWAAALAMLDAALPFIGADNAFALHQAARAWPAVVALPLAAAVASLFGGTAPSRATAALCTLVAATTTFLGSAIALDLMSRDPLRMPSPMAPTGALGEDEIGRMAAPKSIASMRVSPDGRTLLLIADQEEHPNVAFVGRAGAQVVPLEAADGVFVDDRQLVVMTRSDTSVRVRLVDVETAASVWSTEVPALSWAQLARDRDGAHWSLIGFSPDSGTDGIQYVRGTIAGDIVLRRQWPITRGSPASRGQPLAVVDDRVVTRTSAYVPGWLDRLPFALRWRADLLGRMRSRIFSLGPADARELVASDLVLSCMTNVVEEAAPICTSYDGHVTRILAIDPGTGAATSVAAVDADMYVQEYSSPRALTGWHRGGSFALDLDSRVMVGLPGRVDGEWHIALGGNVAAVSSIDADGDGETVRVYPIRR